MGDGDSHIAPWTSLIILLLLIISCSGCLSLTSSSIPPPLLTMGWHENTALRNSGSQILGMEKWWSTTYEITGNYPASVTVTTLKTLVLSDKLKLQQDVAHTVETTFYPQIQLQEQSRGERTLRNGHSSRYIVYSGQDTRTNETVRIIGEVWNCDKSGTSIICIGLAYLTSHKIPGVETTKQWQKIVGDTLGTIEGYIDEKGLLYSIACH